MTDTNQASEYELDDILIRFGVYIAEYANFGSPYNSDDENIAGAEALYQTSLQEAKQAILDWHNKQVEGMLDSTKTTIVELYNLEEWQLTDVMNAIEAERNKLKESSDDKKY